MKRKASIKKIFLSVLIILSFPFLLNSIIKILSSAYISKPANLFDKLRNWFIEISPFLTVWPMLGLLIIYFFLLIINSPYVKFKLPLQKLYEQKFIDSFYFGGLRAFLFSLLLVISLPLAKFWDNHCANHLYFLESLYRNICVGILMFLCLMPLFFFYGKFSRYVDDEQEGIKKAKTKRKDILKERGMPQEFMKVFEEEPALSFYERVSRFAMFFLPLLYLYSNHNLLYPYDEFVLWFVSIFLIFNLSMTALVFISVPDLTIRKLLSLISFRYEMIFAIINIDTYLIKKTLPNIIYLKHFLLIYVLVCFWAILAGYKNFFLINKERKVQPGHYYFLGGLMFGTGVALFLKNIDLFTSLNIKITPIRLLFPEIYLLAKIFSNFIISISTCVIFVAIIMKKNSFLSKRDAIYLIIVFVIFLFSWCYFVDFKAITNLDYAAILCILPIPAISLISLRKPSIRTIFIIRIFYLLLYFCFALFIFGIIELPQIKKIFVGSLDALMSQWLVIIVSVILASIVQNKIKNRNK